MNFTNKVWAALLMFALCGAPELVRAAQQPTSSQPPAASHAPTPAVPAEQNNAPQTTPAQQQSAQSGVTVDPSQGPLEPVPSESVEEPATGNPQQPAAQSQPAGGNDQQTQNLPEKPVPQKPAEPVGAATAEKGRTLGGAASKPAGTAIAPAKQRQVRSWLIRIGAIAAAGAAAGTIYGLSRRTPSVPPGTTTIRAASH